MPVRALARVDLAAIEHNVALIGSQLNAGTRFCAVVKADAYGHGAVPVARAALNAGASWLAVATAAEAAQLRDAGLQCPVLVLGALSSQELPLAIAARADLVAWTPEFVAAVAAAAPGDGAARIHVKLDTGMGRLGTREEAQARATAEAIEDSSRRLSLVGAMTHFATADEPDTAFLHHQLECFAPFVEQLRRLSPRLIAHVANSAAALREPSSHFDMVRCGIGVYGCDPMNLDPGAHGLEPALELSTYVAAVKLAEPGQSTGYGRRFTAERPTWVATLPIGYADGVPRALANNCDVLIGGRRCPLVGAVSMDNIAVALGDEPTAAVGDRAVLIGRDGDERQTAEELARRAGTINYEIVCGISRRVPREHHRGSAGSHG